MTIIEIKETGKKEKITVIDPKTGVDWSGDLIGNACSDMDGYNDDGETIMTQDNFNWWENYCSEYQKADELVNEFFQDIKTDCWKQHDTGAPEDAYLKETEMQELYNDTIGGVEFNDVPAAMKQFVKENTKK